MGIKPITRLKIVAKAVELIQLHEEILLKDLLWELSRNGCGDIYIDRHNLGRWLGAYAPPNVKKNKEKRNGRSVTVYRWEEIEK